MDGAPATPDQRLLLSRLAASQQWDRLLEAARSALARNPDDARAHRYAAQTLINLDRHAEAEPHLAQVLSQNPNDDYAHRLLSIVHFALGRFAQADAEVRQAISLNPREPHHWHHLARMCYLQKDKASALKWIAKARELAPDNPNILNLHALCSGDAGQSVALLREALARDPENAIVHNNLGTHYLNQLKDYPQAEACFRRALAIDPALKLARRNLFITLRHRDRIYRALRAPLDFLLLLWRGRFGGRRRNPLVILLAVVAWIILFRFVIGGIALWFALVWPMLKIYEFLVVGDIRRATGELGARRGGFLGYRGWPLHLRLGLFAALLVGFWSGLGFLVYDARQSHSPAAEKGHAVVLSLAIVAISLVVLFILLKRILRKSTTRYHSWRRSRRLRNLEIKTP